MKLKWSTKSGRVAMWRGKMDGGNKRGGKGRNIKAKKERKMQWAKKPKKYNGKVDEIWIGRSKGRAIFVLKWFQSRIKTGGLISFGLSVHFISGQVVLSVS